MPMGLDMYAFVTAEKPLATVDFETFHSERLHYWRKHPDLDGSPVPREGHIALTASFAP